MSASLVVVIGLTTVIFFSTVLIVAALFMRNRWDKLAEYYTRTRQPEPRRKDWWERH